MMADTKRCPKCLEVRPITDFYRDRHAASGRQWKCRFCMRTYNRALRRRIFGKKTDSE